MVATVIFLTIIDVIIFDTEYFCLLMSFPFELRIFFFVVKAAKNALGLLIFFPSLFGCVFYLPMDLARKRSCVVLCFVRVCVQEENV